MAEKKLSIDEPIYVYGNLHLEVRPRIPAKYQDGKLVDEGKPSVSYHFKKSARVSGPNTISRIGIPLTVKDIHASLKRACPTLMVEEVQASIDAALSDPLSPIWLKNQYLELTKGEFAAEQEKHIQSLSVEIEEMRKKNAALEDQLQRKGR